MFGDFQAHHEIELSIQTKRLRKIHDADKRRLKMCQVGTDLGEFHARNILYSVFPKPSKPGAGATANVYYTGWPDEVNYQRHYNGSGEVGALTHRLIELISIWGVHFLVFLNTRLPAELLTDRTSWPTQEGFFRNDRCARDGGQFQEAALER